MLIFGSHDARTEEQLARCASATPGTRAVLCADGHLGYSMPIGGVVAYPDHVSPSGVGYDIGCGNMAALTNLRGADLGPQDWSGLADRIHREVSFGVGRVNDSPVDHPVLDQIEQSPIGFQRHLAPLAAKQLGTVGSGNHYVDVFLDEQDRVWVGVHFGSRGFGHKTATAFLNLAQGKLWDDRPGGESMDAPPTLLSVREPLGQDYIKAMQLAGGYAYAGREVVVDTVLDILGAQAISVVHNHHNFAWRETHQGTDYWVVRKGATPAWPGQRGFVGGSMGTQSVILEGVESLVSREALYSTVHGAGRAMSRTEAAGKVKWVRGEDGRKRPQRVGVGKVDFDAERAKLVEASIELRGAGADEAPPAYKHLPDVLAEHAGTIRILHTLTPKVVVMAGGETFDPYKD